MWNGIEGIEVEWWGLTGGAFLAAMISGTAGFGGALLLLPLLTLAFGPERAVPLLTIAQLVGNLARAILGWRDIRWRFAAWFLAGAIPAGVVGALLFTRLSPTVGGRVIGVSILIVLALSPKISAEHGPRAWIAVTGGFIAGLLSGLAGSAGPLSAAFFLSFGLPPAAYVATEAFAAAILHTSKWAVYQRALAIGPETWVTAAWLGAVMIAGTATARRLLQNINHRTFRIVVSVLLAGMGLYLLVKPV